MLVFHQYLYNKVAYKKKSKGKKKRERENIIEIDCQKNKTKQKRMGEKKRWLAEIDHSRNTVTYHNALCFVTPKICISIVFSFSWELKWPQEKLKTMLIQNFGVTSKEHYGMLWYFLEWSI